ncbi:SCO family protein [Sporosarcina sp. Sa2YVA2]|uniref:SCO family protein n=1 Tax=Sporosarcina quadrami TaxID=2762234 RepID=A0ABR8U5D9_9BACL|nr:SCO family protein [Sporosarcina quadrami]MBD7983259.1 SCO family protein [Sporosarcina quadrami]
MANNKTSFSIVLVMLFGIGLFFIGTDGFTAFTAETARVNKLLEDQPEFPPVTFQDSKERQYSIDEFKGNYVLITFFYSACTTVCIDLEMNMSELYDKIPKKYIGNGIDFLSISFDPKRDDPAKLDLYKNMFNSDGETWRMARIPDQQELDGLLDEFGVIVIPDDYGNYAHNSAFYLVNPNGKLSEVMDFRHVDAAAETILAILDSEADPS